MNFILFALVVVVALFASATAVSSPAPVEKDFACNDFNNNCLSCIQFAKNLAFQCTYCPVDGVCHTVGSLFNKCNNDQCVSLSAASTCKMNTADDCKNFQYGDKAFLEGNHTMTKN